jgi:hypothetical protein
MSFSSHRTKVHDESIPLDQRASHARSCALHVANKLGVARETVIEAVARETGISLHAPNTSERLAAAFQFLDALRQGRESISA